MTDGDLLGLARWYAYILKKYIWPKYILPYKYKKDNNVILKALEYIEKHGDYSIANSLADDFLSKRTNLGFIEADVLFFMISRTEELLSFIDENPDCFDDLTYHLAKGEYAKYFEKMDSLYKSSDNKRFNLVSEVENVHWLSGKADMENADRICVVEVGGIGDGLYTSTVYGYLQDIVKTHGVYVSVFVDHRLKDIYERTYEGVKFVPCIRHYVEVSDFWQSVNKARLYNKLPRRTLSRYFDNQSYEKFSGFDKIITSMGLVGAVYGEHRKYEKKLVEDTSKIKEFEKLLPKGKKCGVALGSLNMKGLRKYLCNNILWDPIIDKANSHIIPFGYDRKGMENKNIVNINVDKVNEIDYLVAIAKNLDVFVGDGTANTYVAARAGCPTLQLSRGALGAFSLSDEGDGLFIMHNVKGVNTLNFTDVHITEEMILDIINSSEPAKYILKNG